MVHSDVETAAVDGAVIVPANGWQSIETAPRDGTKVDLYGTRNDTPTRFTDARWSEEYFGGNPTGRFSWAHRGWDHYGVFIYTHWMPLPLPPDDRPTPA